MNNSDWHKAQQNTELLFCRASKMEATLKLVIPVCLLFEWKLLHALFKFLVELVSVTLSFAYFPASYLSADLLLLLSIYTRDSSHLAKSLLMRPLFSAPYFDLGTFDYFILS